MATLPQTILVVTNVRDFFRGRPSFTERQTAMLSKTLRHQKLALVATARLKRVLISLENASDPVRTNPLASWAKKTLSSCLDAVGQYCGVADADRENRRVASRLYSCDIQFVIDELMLVSKDLAAIHVTELDETACEIAEVIDELQQAMEGGEFSPETPANLFRFVQ